MSLGELSRLVGSALVRIEGVAARLEGGQFVRSDVYDLQIKQYDGQIGTKVSTEAHAELKARVLKLEEANTWLVRIVVGFVVLAVLGLVISQTGGAK